MAPFDPLPDGAPMRLQAAYSTASTEAVAAFVEGSYGLPAPVACVLLQRGFNDTFQVTDAMGSPLRLAHVLPASRGEADVASETEFLRHLEQAGVPVVRVQPTSDGAWFSSVEMAEGVRSVVLFHYIEGRNPDWESLTDARLDAVTLARMHAAAATYADWDRCAFRLDLDHLLHRPVAAVLDLPGLPDASRTKLTALEQRLAKAVAAIEGLSWTRCHGDCHGANSRIPQMGDHAGEAVLYDFDDGGPGYLAYDLAVHLWSRMFFSRAMQAHWVAFVQAYHAVRPIAAADLRAVPVFAAIRHLWFLGEYASRAAEWGSSSDWFGKQIDAAVAWEADRLGPDLLS